MLEFISKLSFNKGLQISVMIFGNLVAPYWFLHHFRPHLVDGDNVVRQIILCLAIGIPLTLLGFSIHLARTADILKTKSGAQPSDDAEPKRLSEEERMIRDKALGEVVFDCLTRGSTNTAVALYLPVVLLAFTTVTFSDARLVIGGAFVGTVVSAVENVQKAKRRKRNAKTE